MTTSSLPVLLGGKPIWTKAWEPFPKIMHAALEPVTTLSFFREGHWQTNAVSW